MFLFTRHLPERNKETNENLSGKEEKDHTEEGNVEKRDINKDKQKKENKNKKNQNEPEEVINGDTDNEQETKIKEKKRQHKKEKKQDDRQKNEGEKKKENDCVQDKQDAAREEEKLEPEQNSSHPDIPEFSDLDDDVFQELSKIEATLLEEDCPVLVSDCSGSSEELPTLTRRRSPSEIDICGIMDKLSRTPKDLVPQHLVSSYQRSIIWANTIQGILSGELDDVAVNITLQILAKKSPKRVFIIDSFLVSPLLQTEDSHKRNYERVARNLSSGKYDVAIGAVHEGCTDGIGHWSLLVLKITEGHVIYINPLGETKDRLKKIEACLEEKLPCLFMKKPWKFVKMAHTKQKDGLSCGVHIIKFAEILLMDQGQLTFNNDGLSLDTQRKSIAQNILMESENLSVKCRKCGTKGNRRKEEWVGCDSCTAWLHIRCSDMNISMTSLARLDFKCPLCRAVGPGLLLSSTPKLIRTNAKKPVPTPKGYSVKRKTGMHKKCACCGRQFTGAGRSIHFGRWEKCKDH